MTYSRVAKCFVSYCWEDIDRPVLQVLLAELRDRLKGQVEFIMDEEKLPHGHSISEFTRLLREVDGVLVILTPAYRRKVLERKGGVDKEFSIIVERFFSRKEESGRGSEDYFALFPILFSGTHETAIPSELNDYKYADFSGFRVKSSPRGKSKMTAHTKKHYRAKLKTIADDLLAVTVLHSKGYEDLFQEYFADLFGELKAGWTTEKYRSEDQHKSLLVKTRVFERVQNQAACFIIGRKGSGKSTLAQVFSADHRGKYLASININADVFNLEMAYLIFGDLQIESDMDSIVSRDVCFSLAWSLFFYLSVLDCICLSLCLNSWQKEKMGVLREHLIELLGDGSGAPKEKRYSAYFVYSCNRVTSFVRSVIAKARSNEDFFLSDIELSFTRKGFFSFTFPNDKDDVFGELLGSMSKKFLITLDGFDSRFANFRRNSIGPGIPPEVARNRARFEVSWLRALLTVAVRIRASDSKYGHSANLIDFCVTVPKDRFVEVRDTERDGYQYIDRYSALIWSGIELSILIRKRMERLGGCLTKKIGGPRVPPRERLEKIWSERFRHIPELLTFEFNGLKYRIPTYIYILRHTFWRPRDVLYLTAHVLALGEEARQRGHEVSVAAVRRAVKDSTEEMLKTEFLGEFASVVLNFSKVIGVFQGCSQVLSGSKLSELVRTVPFTYATGVGYDEDVSILKKVEYLYDIGMIGIQASEKVMQQFALECKHAFFFNEGRPPMLAAQRLGIENCEFVIHPVFSESLSLDTSGNELIFNFDWEYLEENEKRMFSQPQRWF